MTTDTGSSFKKIDISLLNKTVVSIYKAAGFIVLAALLMGLFYFIGINTFFFTNRTWVAPMILSPTDERVLTLMSQIAQQSSLHDKLSAERIELQARLAEAERTVATMERFRSQIQHAVSGDLQLRSIELYKTKALLANLDANKPQIIESNNAFSQISRSKIDQLWAAHLVDSDGYVNAGHQIAKAMEANLGLDQTQIQIEMKALYLAREISAFKAIGREIAEEQTNNQKNSGVKFNYEALKIMEEHNQTMNLLARAKSDREVIKQALIANENSIANYNKLLNKIRESPYLQAADGNIAVAFVPYNNAPNASIGTSLYGCSLGVLWCKKIGVVAGVLEGEISGRHPMRNQIERGLMIRMKLTDTNWAKEKFIFAGKAPFYI